MKDRIKSAFDSIQAEDSLKTTTLRHLREKTQKNTRPRSYYNIRRLAAIAVCFVFVLSAGLFSYNLYFTKAAYIDLDINPSLALAINRFDRVIDIETYNADADKLLLNLNLRHKKADAVMNELIAAAAKTGYLRQDGLVSVTVQSFSGYDEKLLTDMQANVNASVSHHHSAAQTDVFSVDKDTRKTAHGLHISPAKYLAIKALQEVDSTASVEQCKNHSIGEIRRLTQEHGKNHHESNDKRGNNAGGHHRENGHNRVYQQR